MQFNYDAIKIDEFIFDDVCNYLFVQPSVNLKWNNEQYRKKTWGKNTWIKYLSRIDIQIVIAIAKPRVIFFLFCNQIWQRSLRTLEHEANGNATRWNQ